MDGLIGKSLLLLSAALLAAAPPEPTIAAGPVPPPCPPALVEAARLHLDTLRARQERVRLSTAAAPEGVEQIQEFDRAAHDCHLVPGQRRRDYGEPVCRAARSEDRIPVRYPYRMHHRQAGSVSALFDAPWKDGPGAALEVEFELRGEVWAPGEQRELLDIDQDGGE